LNIEALDIAPAISVLYIPGRQAPYRLGEEKPKGRCEMRTLTSYGIAVIIVFAILNGIAWLVGFLRLHDLNVFSAGFMLGMLGMYIAAWLYGYHQLGVN
jgi:hypothetical protein